MKRTISFLLAVLMMFTLLPLGVLADEVNAPTIRIESVYAQQGKTVTVDVSLENNPGIISTSLEFSFPEGLTLVSAESGEAFSALSFTPPAQLSRGEAMTGSCRFAWFASDIDESEVVDGTILTLTFEISEDAALNENFLISLKCAEDDTIDKNGNSVAVKTSNGYVSIINYTPCDVNDDTSINMKDVVLLCRYIVDGCVTDPNGYNVTINDNAANVNGDYKITMLDVVWICRYIVDGCISDVYGYYIIPLPSPGLCKHTMEHHEAVAATCEEAGNVEYWYCTSCEKYYSDADGRVRIALEDTVIEPLGHDPVLDQGYPAEVGKAGLTDGYHCDRCGEILVAQEIIDPLPAETASITYKLVNESKDPYLAQIAITNPNENYYKIGEVYTLSNDISVPGYTFVGWFDSFDDDATQIKEIPATSNKEVTLYAHWKEITYDITYNTYQTPVTSTPTEKQLHYTVSQGNFNLYNPEINNYKFLGWYDENGVEYKTIPIGTTGNIVLNAYYTSLRNLAVSKTDDNPIIVADSNNNVVYFTYEIGEIRNIPLNGDSPYWTIQSVAGLSQQVSKTYTTTITTAEASAVSKTITDMTVTSNTWTLAETWNDVISVNESWAESIGKTTEQCRTEATTSSNTFSLTNQQGGSSYHKTEDGTTVYDYNSKTETNEKGHEVNASVSGTYSNKISANLGASNEYGTEDSYSASNAYTAEGKATSDNWSASGSSSGSASGSSSVSDKDKYSAGLSYENGYEINAGVSYGYKNNTTTVTKTGSDSVSVDSEIDETTSSWNCSATSSATNEHSVSETVRNTLSDIVTTTKSYGSTYSNGGTDSTTQGFSSTESNTAGTTSTVTYSKLESETTTTTYSVDGKIEGKYRCILVGTAHVYGVVGYDYNTKSYFTYTFSVMDDKTEEFLDYTPKGCDFDDCENSCLPFEIPTDIFDYVNERTVITTGVVYRTDSVNGTAKVVNYTGTCTDVIVPAYVSDGEQAYKVTEIASTAFAGKSVRSVVLGEFIESIPDGAFKNCTNLEGVIGSFTEIGDEAFAGCTKLTNMNIPSDVVNIGENAFDGANSITVRAVNSLAAYAAAAKALPEGTDAEIEAKQKEITLELIDAVLNSGAQNISIDLSNVVSGVQLALNVPAINSIEINGGGKTYSNFSLNSEAKYTTINAMTITNTSGVPLTINSEKLTLRKVFVNAKAVALILKQDGAILSLNQDSALESAAAYTVIGKNPVIESVITGGAAGFVSVVGNFGYVNSVSGDENAEITNGSFVQMTEEEFNKYVQGFCNISFDAGEGTLKTGEESKQAYIGEAIGTLPIPTRDYYNFAGWYTKAEGGDKITADTVTEAVGDVTYYAHWTPKSYTVTWSTGTGYTITVNRTSSPNANADTGVIENGATVYYGDVLSVTYKASTGYTLGDTGASAITVSGKVTSNDIYASATANKYKYTIVYKSVNGTNLGSTTATYAYGTTNTISAPAKTGYTTPSSQTIKWDSTSAKTITFIYTPKSVSNSTITGTFNSSSPYISYATTMEYADRTATSVKVRITTSVTIQSGWSGYGYGVAFDVKCGSVSSGQQQIADYNGLSSGGTTRNNNTGWLTIPLSTTNATTLSFSANMYNTNYYNNYVSGYDYTYNSYTWTMNIPAY